MAGVYSGPTVCQVGPALGSVQMRTSTQMWLCLYAMDRNARARPGQKALPKRQQPWVAPSVGRTRIWGWGDKSFVNVLLHKHKDLT